MNREFALKFGEDPIYLQDPAQITALIQNIPDTLKREVMQRIISSDLKTTKMDVFNDLSMLITNLSEIPADDRALILPYSDILL